jgi:hypothetical protein
MPEGNASPMRWRLKMVSTLWPSRARWRRIAKVAPRPRGFAEPQPGTAAPSDTGRQASPRRRELAVGIIARNRRVTAREVVGLRKPTTIARLPQGFAAGVLLRQISSSPSKGVGALETQADLGAACYIFSSGPLHFGCIIMAHAMYGACGAPRIEDT